MHRTLGLTQRGVLSPCSSISLLWTDPKPEDRGSADSAYPPWFWKPPFPLKTNKRLPRCGWGE